MRLTDKSNGFWTDIFIRRKNPLLTFKQNYMPDQHLTKLFAEEGINAIKGSTKHRISVRHVAGRVVIAKFPNGKYSTGIMQRKSPDGTPYEPLSSKTLSKRIDEGNSRGPAFILRETGQHIMNGLKVLSNSKTRNGSKSEIGWTGENAIRAEQHDKGFTQIFEYTNKAGETSEYPVEIVARKFIGLSQELLKNLQSTWNKIGKVK